MTKIPTLNRGYIHKVPALTVSFVFFLCFYFEGKEDGREGKKGGRKRETETHTHTHTHRGVSKIQWVKRWRGFGRSLGRANNI